jgi:hypothetical protein
MRMENLMTLWCIQIADTKLYIYIYIYIQRKEDLGSNNDTD